MFFDSSPASISHVARSCNFMSFTQNESCCTAFPWPDTVLCETLPALVPPLARKQHSPGDGDKSKSTHNARRGKGEVWAAALW